MFSKFKKILFVNLLLIGVFAAVNFALAGVDVGLGFGAGTGLGQADPRAIAANIIRIALAFLGIIAVGLVAYGGFLWMTAAGDESKIETAKKLLISAVIGLIIILSAFAIASFVLSRLLSATNNVSGNVITDPILPPIPNNVSCSGNPLTLPVCEPDNNICTALNPDYYCYTGAGFWSCRCRYGGGIGTSCDADDVLASCQAEPGMCSPSLICNTTTCLCERGSAEGEACDLDLFTTGCQVSTSTCSGYLTCDSGDCLCKAWPIIEWISPKGGFCSDEINKACLNDSECTLTASSTCNQFLPNAASGNIITIGGHNFGNIPGQVLFWNGSDFALPGVSPKTLNNNCVSNWSDDQIITVVPAGAITGAIRIIRADALSDDTNNSQGPLVSDLLINTIFKPGLCLINPAEQFLNRPISYYGIKFSLGSLGKFGNYISSEAGVNSSFISDLSGSTTVPNITDGQTTTFVSGLAGETSNYLRFRKLASVNRGPYIISFEPATGAPGQYVTINGSGFGASRGKNDVYFGDETGYAADFGFPEICADSVWSDNQIIVKAPTNAPDGNYLLTLKIGSNFPNTINLSQPIFTINRAESLLPSLCRISPSFGDVDSAVSLWGEYFDAKNASSRVSFYNNKEVSGTAISFWDLDSGSKVGIKPYRVDTVVAAGAITGPVKIIKGANLSGNSLNFNIGSCLEATNPNNACSPQICCAAGTYKAGRCVNSLADCAMDIPSSVYEWDFNTGLGTTTINTDGILGSCAERSRLLSLCDKITCPNSPGECSPFDNLINALANTSNCAFSCEGVGSCTAATCSYNSALDLCVANGGTICSMPIKVNDSHNNLIDAFCGDYKGTPRRMMYIGGNSNCTSTWVMDVVLSGNSSLMACIDLNSTCTRCSDNYSCASAIATSTTGSCVVPVDICPSGSTCQADNKCKKTAPDECQCCCRKANSNQDCCIGLTCEGVCGSDQAVNTNTYGSCGGCRRDNNNDGFIDAAEQIASDAACNCAGTSGKYCDVNADPDNDGVPEGVCGDCAQLSTNQDCTIHSTSCCVDAQRNEICTGLQYSASTTLKFTPVISGGVSYCGYYPCQNNNQSCNGIPVVKPTSTAKYFKSLIDCQTKCGTTVQTGISCAGKSTTTCETSVCGAPFSCLTENGGAPTPLSDCGTCCCDPFAAINQCANVGSPDLRCQPDVSPCSGGNRGLCCGCSLNTDCVAGGNIPDTVGCGDDSCCRARPSVVSTVPIDGKEDICTNGEIQVRFNQKMDTDSFRGSVIVVGEYSGSCPAGTVYLAANENPWQKKNIFARTIESVLGNAKIFIKNIFVRNALASDPPVVFRQYCAINGTVDSEHIDSEKGPTILKFRPNRLLDPETKYFVIIKGDLNLDNTVGVENFWGIGMNIPPAASPVINSAPFNGIAYPASYVWSFITRSENGDNKGVCDISKVVINPNSYLFSKNVNDLNENDIDPKNGSFDTVRDSDKKFIAKALSSQGEVLFSAPDYSWDWSWEIEDAAVASIDNVPFSATSASQLIRAAGNITDRRTKASTTLHLIENIVSRAGDGASARADIFVFICNNPWPIFAADGTWRPWMDNPYGMACVTGNCLDMRYELYYCRDNGNDGTVDDLPVLSGGTTIGQVAGSEVLKESYFFRQTPPSVENINLNAQPGLRGGEVFLNWNKITDSAGKQTVAFYKISYGTVSGVYGKTETISAANAPYQLGKPPILISGLDKNKDYYFVITAVYANGEESKYSNEVKVRPEDKEPPAKPTGLMAEVPRTNVEINVGNSISSWQKNSTEKISLALSVNASEREEILKHLKTFDLRYGTSSGVYYNVVSLPARNVLVNNEKIIIERDFTAGTPYYFAVSASRNDNTSAERAGEFKVVFYEDGRASSSDVNPKKSSESFLVAAPGNYIKVYWDPNKDDTVEYKLYWGVASTIYGESMTVLGRDSLPGKTKKEASFNYVNTLGKFFITLTAVDSDGNESIRANEIIVVPSA